MSNDLKSQVKVFLYELNNTRHEYGFAAAEEWTLDLATSAQKNVLENKFYPILSLTIVPEQLMEVLDLLQDKLSNAVSKVKDGLSPKNVSKDSTNLIAYCSSRLKY